MKDWFKLEPDRVRIMNKHFSIGRGGRKIKHVTRHHMGGIGDVDQCWQWWQTREASAHYAVSPTGEIGQLVWDRDTAWANASTIGNQETIAIEHSNSGGGAQGWPISDVTIREGARLAASVCFVHALGRPEFNKNIKDHCQFNRSTECPYHLREGWKYHEPWMRAAQSHYDWMVRGAAGGNKIPEKKDVLEMDRAELRKIIFECMETYVGPIGSDVKDIREQLTGSRDAGEYAGWGQLGQNDEGANLTVPDAIAALRRDVNGLHKEIKR